MLNPDTAKAAAENGEIVYLDADFETCYSRICGDSNRPIAASSSKEELLERFSSRKEIYKAHSTIQIEATGTPGEISDRIAEIARG